MPVLPRWPVPNSECEYRIVGARREEDCGRAVNLSPFPANRCCSTDWLKNTPGKAGRDDCLHEAVVKSQPNNSDKEIESCS